MTTPPRQRYPEKHLQDTAVEWMVLNWGYEEVFSDSNALGARMDSVGRIGDQVFLVEVKVDVGADIVDHADDRPSSLESKIAGALRPIYQRSDDGLAEIVNAKWDRQHPLVVVILARSFTPDSLTALSKMMASRSEAWKFDFRLWVWRDGQVVEMARAEQPFLPPPSSYEQIEIPTLIGRAPRSPSRTMEEFRGLAIASKVEHLFDAAVDEACKGGFRVRRRRGTIGLLRCRPGRASPETIIALYLDTHDTEARLWVGCWVEAIDYDPAKLPGVPAPPNGFLNTNLYLSSPEEVRELVRLFASASGLSNARPSP